MKPNEIREIKIPPVIGYLSTLILLVREYVAQYAEAVEISRDALQTTLQTMSRLEN
jgi:hypothetical protein